MREQEEGELSNEEKKLYKQEIVRMLQSIERTDSLELVYGMVLAAYKDAKKSRGK